MSTAAATAVVNRTDEEIQRDVLAELKWDFLGGERRSRTGGVVGAGSHLCGKPNHDLVLRSPRRISATESASANAAVRFELMKRFLGWIFSRRGWVALLIVGFLRCASDRERGSASFA